METGTTIAALAVMSSLLPGGQPITHYQLPNGLTLYVVENHSAPVFHYQTWFKTGAKDEKLDPNLGITGLAHLFEHMMFRGTKAHGDGEFDQILTRAGGTDENATTWLDRTNYYESLPKDALDQVMDLESDRMVNLVIDEETFQTERGAVLGEYRMGLDDPDTIAHETLYSTAFVKHPYRYSTIGTEAEIKSFTREQAEYFYRTYYSPGNAVILVVGDVNPEEVFHKALRYYGSIPAQSVPETRAEAEPEQTLSRHAEFTHAQLTEGKLLVAYRTPEARHADIPALWVAQSILTVGEGSVLQAEWVNAGLASDVSGSLDQFEDPGLLTLKADLQPGKDEAALLGALDRAVGELGARASEASVERAKNQLLLRVYHAWSDNAGLASFMGEYIASAGDPLYGFDLTAAIEKVTAEDVKRVITKYLRPATRTVVLGKPAPDADTSSGAKKGSGK